MQCNAHKNKASETHTFSCCFYQSLCFFWVFPHIMKRFSFSSASQAQFHWHAVTVLFFVNYTNAHLTNCARRHRDICALLTWWKQSKSVFSHSTQAQTAQRKMIISWNCWFPRCFCLVCKRLQLCMCSAGSVSLPFSTLLKLDKARQLNEGEGPQSVEPVGVPRGSSPLCFSSLCVWQRLVGRRSSHNTEVISL